MTEKELRSKVAAIAEGWVGRKESNGSHKKIIDIYNSHKPLARGYKVKYTDAWCAATVSAAFIEAGLTDIAPTECSCSKMIALYKNIGGWKEADSYTPEVGDLIMYDFDDTGAGENTGAPDHVGIVVSVSGKIIKVVEGNKNNAVGYRSMTVNGRYIRGYCTPDFAAKATAPAAPKPTTTTKPATTQTSTAVTIHTVVKGDTLWKLATKYLGKGSRFTEIVKLNGLKSTILRVGQKITIPTDGTATSTAEKVHTVKKGDSLWAIAKKYLGNGARYPEIVKLNGLKSTVLSIGQKLRIPKK